MTKKEASNRQTWSLIPALLLIVVPFWSIFNNTYIFGPELILWYGLAMVIPVAVILLLVIRHRLNSGGNILLASKILRGLMYFVIFIFLVLFIDSILTAYNLGLNIMMKAVQDMPLYVLPNFIADILIISLLSFAIRYSRITCDLVR